MESRSSLRLKKIFFQYLTNYRRREHFTKIQNRVRTIQITALYYYYTAVVRLGTRKNVQSVVRTDLLGSRYAEKSTVDNGFSGRYWAISTTNSLNCLLYFIRYICSGTAATNNINVTKALIFNGPGESLRPVRALVVRWYGFRRL